jgi:hypothetical protein
MVFINEGGMKFRQEALPAEAQFSRVYGAINKDFDKDGKNDLLLSGNFFPYNVRLGRNDAALGMLLKGNGKDKGYEPVYPENSGFFAGGDVRKMVMLNMKSGTGILLAKNNESLQLFMAP